MQAQPTLDFLWLELTNRCNLQCEHCYSKSSPTSGDDDILNEADYLRLIAESYALGCRQIQFIGGEPTLNRSLPAFVAAASATGYEFIEVFTNLVSLGEPLLDAFTVCGVSVATSFYSCSAVTHDRITRSIGSHAKTIRNIKKVLAAGVPLRVGVIETDLNAGEFEATAGFLRELGVTDVGFDKVRGFGRAQETETCSMDNLCGQCATNVLAVGPDGKVAPCIMSKQWAVGSVVTDSLAEIVGSSKLRATREAIAEATTIEACQPACGPNRQQCMPECGPSRQCTPCGPNAGHKCGPNSFCSPAR